MQTNYKKTIIGVIGASKINKKTEKICEQLGTAIAKEGWVTLTGGEPVGVMEYGLKGAAEAGGDTIGILPGDRSKSYSKFITIPIFTNADLSRDYFNILTADVVVIVGKISAGTMIEVAYALKKNIPIVLLQVPKTDAAFVVKRSKRKNLIAADLQATIKAIRKFV